MTTLSELTTKRRFGMMRQRRLKRTAHLFPRLPIGWWPFWQQSPWQPQQEQQRSPSSVSNTSTSSTPSFSCVCIFRLSLSASISSSSKNGFYSGRVTHTIVISQVVVQPNRIKIHSKIDEELALCKYDGYITSQTPSAYRSYTQWRF